MATQAHRPSVNGVMPKKPATPRAPVKRPSVAGARQAPNGVARPAPPRAAPAKKAYSVAGDSPSGGGGVSGAYAIMASRIANRVAEMAESITFVERPQPNQQPTPSFEQEEKRKPRKLEMRLGQSNSGESVAFSAPFLDNTLQKMLLLQNRMLKTTADLSKAEGVEEKVIKEHASQSAELSRIIAMICAEKARQGA